MDGREQRQTEELFACSGIIGAVTLLRNMRWCDFVLLWCLS